MLYLTPWLGTGNPGHPVTGLGENSYRLPLSHMPGRSLIDIRPDCTLPGYALQWVPGGTADARYTKVADGVDEPFTATMRTRLGNALSTTPRGAAMKVNEALVHLLTDYTLHPLVPVRQRGPSAVPGRTERRVQLTLGSLGLVWDVPYDFVGGSQTISENWPTNVTNASLGTQVGVWTTTTANFTVASNKVRKGNAGADATLTLDTVDIDCDGTYDATAAAVNQRLDIFHRYLDNANHYFTRINGNTVAFQRGLFKVIAGTQTTLASDTTDPSGTAVTIHGSSNGSNIRGIAGSFDSGVIPDSTLATGSKAGIRFSITTTTNVQLNATVFKDIVAGLGIAVLQQATSSEG